MITLDFNSYFKGVDGTDTERKLSYALAEFLATESNGNALKILGWVEKLTQDGILELDEADRRTLEQTIEGTNRLTVILKGQLLRCFLKKD